jgi:nicotinamide mononucleotide transporter
MRLAMPIPSTLFRGVYGSGNRHGAACRLRRSACKAVGRRAGFASASVRPAKVQPVIDYLLQMDWLESSGLVSGLLCVVLLIRQNIWNWPIGLFYSLVSVVVFYRSKLYADLALHVFYVVMNGYGWYYWAFAKRLANVPMLPVVHVGGWTAAGLGSVVVLVTATMGWLLANHTDAALPYWDSSQTTMSFAAMWMTARKHIENWLVWLAVDIIATGIYLVKGLELYALLYGVYIALAVAGWWAWWQSMRRNALV